MRKCGKERKCATFSSPAPVVQWIGRKLAELVMQVRFLPRAPVENLAHFQRNFHALRGGGKGKNPRFRQKNIVAGQAGNREAIFGEIAVAAMLF